MKSNTGIALLLVLWVLALLAVIVGEFARTMRVEVNITQNFWEEHEAYYLALAGFNLGVAGLLDQSIWPDSMERMPDDIKSVLWRVNTDIPEIPMANGKLKVRIENSGGKININQTEQPELLKLLVGRLDIDETQQAIIIDSILDWLDKDHLHRLNGAENDYYQSLPEPYQCRNGKISAIDELRLIRGVDAEVFDRIKPLIVIFPQESPAQEQVTRLDLININAAAEPILAILPGLTAEMIQEIVAYRRKKDFKSMTELLEIIGPEAYQQCSKYLTLQLSPYYTVIAEGILTDGGYRRGIQAFIAIDENSARKYEVLDWIDRI